MEKNMKKIIHLSCLILLPFICNQIRGAEEERMTPIQEAGSQLRQLIIQKENGEDINPDTYNEILGTLQNYVSQATIHRFDTNGFPAGIYETKGWQKNEATKAQVEAVQQQLTQLKETKKK